MFPSPFLLNRAGTMNQHDPFDFWYAVNNTEVVAMPESIWRVPVVASSRAAAASAIAVSPWAPLVAVGGQKQVVLYSSETLQPLGVLPFPEGQPRVLKFSRNGALLLAGGGVLPLRSSIRGNVGDWLERR